MPDEVKAGETNSADGSGTTDVSGTSQALGKPKMTPFDATQQVWVNEHSDTMFGKGHTAATKELGVKFAEAEAKIATLSQELEKLKTPPVVDKGEKPKEGDKAKEGEAAAAMVELEQSRAKIKELQDGLSALKTERDVVKDKLAAVESTTKVVTKRQRFQEAIPENLSFFRPELVFDAIEKTGELQLNDQGVLEVINLRTGAQKLNPKRDMEPMTVAEYLEEFAANNAFLVKSNTTGGTGQGESRTLAGAGSHDSGKIDYLKMTPAELEEKIRKVKDGVA